MNKLDHSIEHLCIELSLHLDRQDGYGSRVVRKETGMGNSAWGHGYHQGFTDGAKKGGAIGVGAALVVALTVKGAILGYQQIKARSIAKREQELPVEESKVVPGVDIGDEHDANEGTTSE